MESAPYPEETPREEKTQLIRKVRDNIATMCSSHKSQTFLPVSSGTNKYSCTLELSRIWTYAFSSCPTEHFSVTFVTFLFPFFFSSRTMQCATINSLCALAVIFRQDPKLTPRFQVCCLCCSLAAWLRPSSLRARGKIQVKLWRKNQFLPAPIQLLSYWL